MITRLKRKQTSDNADWVDVWNHIEEYVSPEEVESAVATAVQAIREATAGKRAVYGWSAGKDSLVLSALCREAGVNECILTRTNLEYPAFERWMMDHRPENCHVNNLGYDLDWLAKHPDMIFPDARHDQHWHHIQQIRGYREAYDRLRPDMIITGHRIADGNVCGKDHFIRKNTGEVRFAPLADWPHELILAYLHYHHVELPPIYGWKDGWVNGTHTWPERGGKVNKWITWGEIYDIDRTIVYKAAEKLEVARRFLALLRGDIRRAQAQP
ncbi:MAG: phosphoadenosine phosphosulfate reductase family protein [Clostridia bacterium]|nr:phosphoadenosine phosphosulfate reductase family protein [Clostridia bacterium]MBQ6121884.1 phosphoadenosine phosphosulfate reductase family protein [Clostridia bacterium]